MCSQHTLYSYTYWDYCRQFVIIASYILLNSACSLAQPDPFRFSFSWGRGKAKGLVTALCKTHVTGMQLSGHDVVKQLTACGFFNLHLYDLTVLCKTGLTSFPRERRSLSTFRGSRDSPCRDSLHRAVHGVLSYSAQQRLLARLHNILSPAMVVISCGLPCSILCSSRLLLLAAILS